VSSRLGVHLRFGTISVRKLALVATELSPIYLNELIWREFFMQVLFHFPETVAAPFDSRYAKVEWLNNESAFARWCAGQTGYPVVDAGMRELNETGYMHNRARMITASFLTKHLLIDWRRGERYFAGKLLDFELAANVGNWQWAAGCGCDAAPYFRVFNPALQAKKFDPEGRYVQRWVPELGTSRYPEPIVDHEMARRRAIATFEKAVKGG
ncbi:MAG: deoxyribodipyrimidine photo-lyase, partial [Calothrix sp. SM1_5_4]|nr:deoxyribodipyrimidine photo-lyase [Calothrix sp. SM1_5_4]